MLPKHSELLDLLQYGALHSTHSVNELEFMLVPTPSCTILAFRGTEAGERPGDSSLEKIQNKWDCIRDARILPWKKKGIPAGQAGFIRGASAVFDALRGTPIQGPYVLCGHSLGGAIALALWAILEAEGKEVHEVVTYGCPKVFYSPKKAVLASPTRITMYKYGKDAVTYVFAGKHPVELTKIGKASSWFPNLKDHGMSSYQIAKHNGELDES